MLLSIFIHDDAQADLDALWDVDETAAAEIEVLLEELEGNQDLLDRLTQNHYGRPGRDTFNVREVENQKQARNNIWRIKIWNLEQRNQLYRIIYAFIPATGYHYVLGVMPREINYDRDHDFVRRVERAYNDLRKGRW